MGILPGVSMEDGEIVPDLSLLVDRVMALDQIVKVDYHIPGCPPPPELVSKALGVLLEAGLPEKGLVFGHGKGALPCMSPPGKHARDDKGKGIQKAV